MLTLGFSRVLYLLALVAIFSMGLVMIFSTTSAEVLDHDLDKSTHQALFRQMGYAAFGLFLGAIIWKIGVKTLLESSPLLLVFFSLLLVLTLIPGIGREVNGSRRWIQIAGFSFQPSEFVKYVVPFYFIHAFLSKRNFCLRSFLKYSALSFIPVLLILIEPNNGTAGVIAASLAVLCFLGGVPFKYWAVPILAFSIVGGVFAYQLPYVAARLNVYMHPELDLKGKGHQPYQARIAAGSGRLWGKGPGNSLQKLSYLPEAQNDYIAAIYAEEFGFAGICLLILCYAMTTYLGFSTAYMCKDKELALLAACISFLFGFQTFMNLGVVSGLLPSTGLNLPLFSQGGTSLMANVSAACLLLNISGKDTVWQDAF